jgi:predicted protein tyrosine phosphatase
MPTEPDNRRIGNGVQLPAQATIALDEPWAVRAGGHVVTHCRFGIGRASLLAAAVLMLEGVDPDKAWRRLIAVSVSTR